MTEEEFRRMLDDPLGDPINWADDEVEEFMDVMGQDGWVMIQ